VVTGLGELDDVAAVIGDQRDAPADLRWLVDRVDISLAQLCQGRFEVLNREAEMVQTLGVMAPRNIVDRRRVSVRRITRWWTCPGVSPS
jgi:hypothetical protein